MASQLPRQHSAEGHLPTASYYDLSLNRYVNRQLPEASYRVVSSKANYLQSALVDLRPKNVVHYTHSHPIGPAPSASEITVTSSASERIEPKTFNSGEEHHYSTSPILPRKFIEANPAKVREIPIQRQAVHAREIPILKQLPHPEYFPPKFNADFSPDLSSLDDILTMDWKASFMQMRQRFNSPQTQIASTKSPPMNAISTNAATNPSQPVYNSSKQQQQQSPYGTFPRIPRTNSPSATYEDITFYKPNTGNGAFSQQQKSYYGNATPSGVSTPTASSLAGLQKSKSAHDVPDSMLFEPAQPIQQKPIANSSKISSNNKKLASVPIPPNNAPLAGFWAGAAKDTSKQPAPSAGTPFGKKTQQGLEKATFPPIAHSSQMGNKTAKEGSHTLPRNVSPMISVASSIPTGWKTASPLMSDVDFSFLDSVVDEANQIGQYIPSWRKNQMQSDQPLYSPLAALKHSHLSPPLVTVTPASQTTSAGNGSIQVPNTSKPMRIQGADVSRDVGKQASNSIPSIPKSGSGGGINFADLDELMASLQAPNARMDAPALKVINEVSAFLQKNTCSLSQNGFGGQSGSKFPTSNAYVSPNDQLEYAEKRFPRNDLRIQRPDPNRLDARSPDLSSEECSSPALLPTPKPKHNFLEHWSQATTQQDNRPAKVIDLSIGCK